MNNKYSIVVPCYNSSNYLNNCIDSILSQSYKNIEIILVDDGSADDTPAICDRFAKSDNRIRVIHQKHSGSVTARQAGISIATGDYSCFIDSDDNVSENYIEKYNDIAEKYNPDIICFNFYRVTKSNTTLITNTVLPGMYSDNSLYEMLDNVIYNKNSLFYHPGICPSLCIKAFRTELIKKCIIQEDVNIKQGDDFACFAMCTFAAKSIYVTNDATYYYNDVATSQTYNFDDTVFSQLESVLINIENNIDTSIHNLQNQLSVYTVFKLDLLFKRVLKKKLPRKTKINLLIYNMPEKLIKNANQAKIKNIGLKKKLSLAMIRSPFLTKIAILFLG